MAPPMRHDRFFLIGPPIDKAATRMLSATSVPPQCLQDRLASRAIGIHVWQAQKVDNDIGTDLV